MAKAGSNLANSYLLLGVNADTAKVDSPLAGYGTLGVNDSGGIYIETRAWTKVKIQLVPTSSTALSGYEVSVYGTTMPEAYQTYIYAIQGRTPSGQSALPFGGSPNQLADAAAGFFPGIPAWGWSLLDGVSDDTDAGLTVNPLTDATPWFNGAGPVTCLRVVLTGSSTPAGSFDVSAIFVP